MKQMVVLCMALCAVQFVAFSASAQSQCTNIFQAAHEAQQHVAYLDTLFGRLLSQEDSLYQAETLKEANDRIYNVVLEANEVLSFATHLLVIGQTGRLSEIQASHYENIINKAVMGLTEIFEVDAQSLASGLTGRSERAFAERVEGWGKFKNKRTIGFLREESSADFHSGERADFPVGFALGHSQGSKDVVKKGPVGFIFFEKSSSVLKKLKQIGFIEFKNIKNAEAEPIAVGFLAELLAGERKVSADEVHRITYDQESGEFSLQPAETQ